MKGRTPKSPEIKKLQGNAGHRAKTPVLDAAAPARGDPPAPQKNSDEIFFSPGWQPASWLPEGAKEIWRQQLPIAIRETKIQESGLQVFAVYCDALYRMQKYSRQIETAGETYSTPSGFVRKRPEVEMRDKASNDVAKFAAELNLTPKSWIGSMGNFARGQLDMFLHGGMPAPQRDALVTPGVPPAKGDSLDAFLGAKPTMQ